MRTIIIQAVLFCLIYLSPPGAIGQTQPLRRVLLAATDEHVKELQTQQKWFRNDPAGLKERDVTLTVITRQEDPIAYQKLNPLGEFTFILIGKDGGEKYRSTRPVTLKTLYSLIDGMPMRQD
jgi:hypothetical protein